MKRFLAFALALLLGGWCTAEAPAQEKNTVPELVALLKDKSVEVRRAAAFSLKFNLQSGSAVQDLIDAFKDSDEVVRANAVDAIVQMTPRVAVPPLTLALKDKDPNVRIESARTLGRIKRYADEAIPNLILLLKDENYDARQAGGEALRRIQSTTREY
jgi:HEAT repeat protein